jgi:choline-sulfatase
MNILYIDIDSLRPDHLGCYGYHRNTSPHMDALALEGVRFTNCYTPDAPCLPSRTAMATGRFGIQTGVINHGGVASQPRLWGANRGFTCPMTEPNWANQLRRGGYHTVAFSPFAQRHGAWHWYAGFMEIHNTGGNGGETADLISPSVIDWLDQKAGKSGSAPFFMWVNLWDPHTPYRTPLAFGNPFREEPLPAWYDERVCASHWLKPGAHSAQEVCGFLEPLPEIMFEEQLASVREAARERQPGQIASLADARRMFDGYDVGVRYADLHVGRIIAALRERGLYEETAIILSADHGENLGELWVYGDHQTADQFTCRVPMIVRWPGVTDTRAGEADDRLLYSLDVAATTLDLAGLSKPERWSGESFAGDLGNRGTGRRDHLILSQAAWCAQRSARWDDFLYIETYHDGFRDYPDQMVFNLRDDPHEQRDLAPDHPELVAKGSSLIAQWREGQMAIATHPLDPMETVLGEGGPLHVRGCGPAYLERLRATERREAADRLAIRHGILQS